MQRHCNAMMMLLLILMLMTLMTMVTMLLLLFTCMVNYLSIQASIICSHYSIHLCCCCCCWVDNLDDAIMLMVMTMMKCWRCVYDDDRIRTMRQTMEFDCVYYNTLQKNKTQNQKNMQHYDTIQYKQSVLCTGQTNNTKEY